jgi:hypothetical protein
MTFATIVFLGLGYTKPRTHRAFHYITAGVTMVRYARSISTASEPQLTYSIQGRCYRLLHYGLQPRLGLVSLIL